MLKTYFADMHIHIGRDQLNQPVKISASHQLTLTNILIEASERKGIQLIGVIDTQSPNVQQEIFDLIEGGQAAELADGGIRFKNVTLLLGAEIEIYDDNCQGPIHVLCFLPNLATMKQFSDWLKQHMKNITLSSQRYYGSAKVLQRKVKALGGLFIPAHVFTPFKSLYGKGVKRSLTEVFLPELIDGIELGLSADTEMADHIRELHQYTYLTNSDAHSLGKIAREYQQIVMEQPSFMEFKYALAGNAGRRIQRNFGLNPKLGKYFTTTCRKCRQSIDQETNRCIICQSNIVIKGVYDRILELATAENSNQKRPPYIYQVPLDFLPTLGPKTYEKLLSAFQTEMNILHEVTYEQLEQVVPKNLAQMIMDMRQGKLSIEAGGGGKYGKIK